MYALRTVILPFIWIFNPTLLLIDVASVGDLLLVVAASVVAMLLFASITMHWLRVRNRWWESLLLGLAVLLLFRPDAFMDRIAPEYRDAPPAEVYAQAAALPEDARLVLVIKGTTIEGDDKVKTVALNVRKPAADGRQRLQAAGLQLAVLGGQVRIATVKFGSAAQKSGFEPGWEVVSVKVRTERPSAHWFYVPGLLLAAFVWWLQGRRLVRTATA